MILALWMCWIDQPANHSETQGNLFKNRLQLVVHMTIAFRPTILI